MRCTTFREALSARLDREEVGLVGLVHVVELAGLGAVWALARRIRRPSVVVRLA